MIKWFFAKNEGGQDSGFHHPGVETFKGDTDRSLARELIQNSIDARYDNKKPVRVEFELLDLKPKDIPDMKTLASTLERCAKYWPDDKKAKEFFNRAIKLATQKSIPALKISDYNTNGVLGRENERKRDFYHLIRSAGASSKTGDEGGSFGIGKNAPFAASQMRTVLYSTHNSEKEHIFIGVATLVSHLGQNGVKAQPVGYLAGKDGLSVRDEGEIPDQFLRTKQGTDIIILGFQREESWQKNLVHSVLENFWPAIEFGNLIVTVGDQQISKSNLSDLLTSYSGEEDFSAHRYYRSYTNPAMHFKEDLPNLKQVTLYLSTGENDLPKKVAMIRKPGMVVHHRRFQSVVPYCGVFVCRNETGNRILREMEPPSHNEWNPNLPEKGMHKKEESEFARFIRDMIGKLMPSDDTKVINVPGLSRFLPDDGDMPEDAIEGGEEQVAESIGRSRLPEKIPARKIDPRHTSAKPDHLVFNEGDGEAVGEGEFPEGEGDGGSGNGEGGGAGSMRKGHGGGEESKPTIPIRYRTFATNVDSGVYSLTVQSEDKDSKNSTLAIWTVGDQGRAPAEISAARQKDGKAIPVKGGILGPLVLPNKKGTLHLEFTLREPLRLAMEVAAHEAE